MAVLNSTALNTTPYNGKKYIAVVGTPTNIGGYNSVNHNRITYNQIQPTAPVTPTPVTRYSGGFNSVPYNRATHNQVLSFLVTTLAPTFNRFGYNSALVYLTSTTVTKIDGGYNSTEYLGVAYNDIQDVAGSSSLLPVFITGFATTYADINSIHMSVTTSYVTIVRTPETNVVIYV